MTDPVIIEQEVPVEDGGRTSAGSYGAAEHAELLRAVKNNGIALQETIDSLNAERSQREYAIGVAAASLLGGAGPEGNTLGKIESRLHTFTQSVEGVLASSDVDFDTLSELAGGIRQLMASVDGLVIDSVAGLQVALDAVNGRIDLDVGARATALAGAQQAQAAAELARDAAVLASGLFANEGDGAAGTSSGGYFSTPTDSGYLALWRNDGDGASTKIAEYLDSTRFDVSPAKSKVPIAADSGQIDARWLDIVYPSVNLANASLFRSSKYYSPGAQRINSSSSYRCTEFIPVASGESYAIRGVQPGSVGAWFAAAADDGPVLGQLAGDLAAGAVVVAPSGAEFLVLNITDMGASHTAFDSAVTVVAGDDLSVDLNPKTVRPEAVPPLLQYIEKDFLLHNSPLNLIDIGAVNYIKRVSVSGLNFVVDVEGIAASDWIPVKEGKTYCVSGAGFWGQGVYFSEPGDALGVGAVEFAPEDGGQGKYFTVPEGVSAVVISLAKQGDNAGATSLKGNVQLEEGSASTQWVPHAERLLVKPELIPRMDFSASPKPVEDLSKILEIYTTPSMVVDVPVQLAVFRRLWLAKQSDLTVVNVGTSLTARTVEHCSDHADAKIRPPLMHSNNFASLIWDRLRWAGQQYRRYDSGFFTESGSWNTSHSLPEWDDGAYRHGLTRYSDNLGASVSFEIPVSAWQFNLIVRTDSVGCDASIEVSDGGGVLQVLDAGSDEWVEAHGYIISFLEPPVVHRLVNVPSASTGEISSRSSPSKGNTTYQRRIKFRCKSASFDSRHTIKSVTVASQSAGRLMYWGAEWSNRQHMITYINAARGSHNTQVDSTNASLPRYQDNEVWSFSPDLMLFELPTHNDGAAGNGSFAGDFFERLVSNFVFNSSYELSMMARAAHFGLAPVYMMFSGSVAWGFGGIDEAGSLILTEQEDGAFLTALDKYHQSMAWVESNHPEALFVDTASHWVRAAEHLFGDLRKGTEGSSKSGPTLTNDGGHWNDIGSKIMAAPVLTALKL